MTKERIIIVVLAVALVAVIAWAFYPSELSEPLGKRLRRECQSVIDEVYPRRFVQKLPSTPPNVYDKFGETVDAGWEQYREQQVDGCVIARSRVRQ